MVNELDAVKEEEEDENPQKQDEVDQKREIFRKHRINKIKGYVNFNNREDTWHDVGEFSWEFHAVDLFSKFLPDLAEALNN